MKVLRLIFGIAVLLGIADGALADPPKVHWTAALRPTVVHAGEHAQIALTAAVDEPWHLYSLKIVPDGNIPTTTELVSGGSLSQDGPAVQPNAKVVRDANFKNALIEYYEQGVAFGVPVKVASGAAGPKTAKVSVKYQVCKQGQCLLPVTEEIPVSFSLEVGAPRAEYLQPVTTVPPQPANYQNYPAPAPSIERGANTGATPAAKLIGVGGDQTAMQIAEAKRKGILNFLLLSFGFGFAALLTPCVFPMIPITVSFFAKTNQEKGGRPDLRGAFAYSLGIIGTFTGLGLLMTAIFGPTGINRLAQSPWTNIVLAALFIVLAGNLFGAFEVVLPSWLMDKAQERKGSGGWLGPMAMGFAFTLTSFTCTVAFVGTLLAAAAQGDWFYPALGMLAFSTAFALPFFLLALFPQLLARLPRSGSWMISVKAFMGFLELAAALKFLSNIDLYLQWGAITRPVFLAIWAALAIVAGFYLWGWLRLSVDTSKRFGMPRRIIGGLSIMAGIWCLAAINGAPLSTLAAFLPPDPYPYKDHIGKGLAYEAEHDWEKAMARAATEHKPIFINFTGAQCTNCRDMEANVLPLPEVQHELKNFVHVDLITDQAGEQSQRNAKLLNAMAHVSTLPYFVIATPDGKPTTEQTGYTKDIPFFVKYLQAGHAASAPKTEPQTSATK